MSPPNPPTPILYSPTLHSQHLPTLANIHRECVKYDGVSSAIIDVEHPTKLLSVWSALSAEVSSGSRLILLQFADSEESEVVGVVSLSTPPSETGPFRSSVEKLFVSPRHRRKGHARRLMERVEEIAIEMDRGLIKLSTSVGYPAEKMYSKLGYICYGVVPKHGICPKTGELVDQKFFYKDLRHDDIASKDADEKQARQ